MRQLLCVQGKKSKKKIKQGAAQEEAGLHQHIRQLSPSQAQLLQASQLAELLLVFGRFPAAQQLQAAFSALQASSAAAAEWLLAHPVQEAVQQGPEQARRQGPPEVQWKWHVLKEL